VAVTPAKATIKGVNAANGNVFDSVDILPRGGNNQAPTVATAAAASPSPATGTTTSLSVLGADDGGEAALIYTWATTGTPPASVAFGANGTNAAKNTTATFTAAGSYSFQVTIKDAGNLTVTSRVTVAVNQTLTTVSVTPASASVATGGTQQFTATGKDQFGTNMATQPTYTWTVTGGGTINSSGLFTAGATAGGPYTVTAASGGKSGMASVTVVSAGTATWDGGGADNNWSTAANWSGDVLPASSQAVVFNATSVKNCTIDVDATVASVQVTSAYTGTITGGAVTVTVTGGNFDVASGHFAAGTSTLKFTGSANQNITSPSAGVTLYKVENAKSAGEFTFFGNSISSINTLKVTAGTITNMPLYGFAVTNLDLQGAAGNLATMRSRTAGTAVSVRLSGSQAIQYVNFKDINASGGIQLNATVGCVDGGNNTNINFTPAP